MIRFDVRGLPIAQGSKRTFMVGKKDGPKRPVIVESSRAGLKPWRTTLAEHAQQHAPEQLLEGPLLVTLAFRLPVPKSAPKTRRLHAVKKPDIDKLTRAVLDAMKNVIYRDDSQIVFLVASKVLAYDEPPGVTITVERPNPAVPPVWRELELEFGKGT